MEMSVKNGLSEDTVLPEDDRRVKLGKELLYFAL